MGECNIHDIDINVRVLKDMVLADPIAQEPVQLQSTAEKPSEAFTEKPNWNWLDKLSS